MNELNRRLVSIELLAQSVKEAPPTVREAQGWSEQLLWLCLR